MSVFGAALAGQIQAVVGVCFKELIQGNDRQSVLNTVQNIVSNSGMDKHSFALHVSGFAPELAQFVFGNMPVNQQSPTLR